MYFKIIRGFSFKSPYLQDLQAFNRQLNLKQTIGEKRNLQRFLETQVKDGKLRSSIQRTTQHDKEFSNFLKEYQSKHRDSPNILDLSNYTRDQESFNKDFEQRKEEILMLEEFRKRRESQFKQTRRTNAIDQRKFFDEKENDEEKDEFDRKNDELSDVEDEEDISGLKRDTNEWNPQKTLGNYKFNKDEFVTLLLHQDVTTLITKLNRINHFRTLIFAGNGNGVIGYGKGKGNDFEEAMISAEVNLKKNLIAIPIDIFFPLPNTIKESFYGFELRLFPRLGGMNSHGSPVIAHMLLLTGITNVHFKCIFRNMNPYAMVLAYFKTVSKIHRPRDISESIGLKIYRQSWGKPVQMDSVHSMSKFV